MLSKRLEQVASMVTKGNIIADIGTDHGYVPIYLVEKGICPKAYAMDINQGPIESAIKNIENYGLSEKIQAIKSNGLEKLEPEKADTIIIAGMGGETILSILKAAPWTADGRHTLLLQPQTHEELVRQYLAENGFTITREALVRDRGTLYTVMEASAGKAELTLTQVWGGVCLLHDPLADRYIIEKIVRTQAALAGAKRSARPADAERAEELRAVLTALLRAREEWRHANC